MKSRALNVLVLACMVLTLFGGICEMVCATMMSESMHHGHHECSGDLCRICTATHDCSMSDGSAHMTHAVVGALPGVVDLAIEQLQAPAPTADCARFESGAVSPGEQPPRA